MWGRIQMAVFSGAVALATVGGLAWVYAFPPQSLTTTRDGVPHFAPPVEHPITGEAVDLGTLVRHYKGE